MARRHVDGRRLSRQAEGPLSTRVTRMHAVESRVFQTFTEVRHTARDFVARYSRHIDCNDSLIKNKK